MSAVLQFGAAGMAGRQATATRAHGWWVVAFAILLMGIRRVYTLGNALLLDKPVDAGRETIALAISAMMFFGLWMLLRRQRNEASAEHSPDTARNRPLALLALVLGACAVLASIGFSFEAHRAEHRQFVLTFGRSNLNIVRALGSAASVDELKRRMPAIDDGTHTCAVGRDGRLLLHSGNPKLVGEDVSGLRLFQGDAPFETLGELARTPQEWVGLLQTRDGVREVIAAAPAPALNGLVMFHAPAALLQEQLDAAHSPWELALGISSAVVIPIPLLLLFLAFSRSDRQRASAETALKSRGQWLSTTLNSIGDAVIATDTERRVSFLNPVACKLIGWPADEARGRSLDQIFTLIDERTGTPVDDPVRTALRDEHNTGVTQNALLVDRNDSRRPIACSAAPIRDDERTTGAVLVFRDQSAERAQEAILRQHQKLESLGTLAAGVAHEINNPITGIMSYGELIQADVEPGGLIAEYASGIVEQSERVGAIVHNLLVFSRQNNQDTVHIGVKKMIDESLTLMRAPLKLDDILLSIDIPEALPPVQCRSRQIQQVLMNLIGNARHALNERFPQAHDDKVLCIGARAFEQDGATLVRITIEDRGSGISPEVLDRVFDPFFTTKPAEQGTGLGLSVSYGIVREHGGRLWAESSPGEHTRFHVELELGADSAPLG